MGLLVLMLLGADSAALKAAQEGSAFAQAGKVIEARDKYEEAHRLAPKDPLILFNLGQLREATGDARAAAEAYEAYLALAPDSQDAADVRARLSRLKLSVPEVARSWLAKGEAYFKLERLDEAVQAYVEAARLAPEWAAPQFNLGVVCETKNDWPCAVRAFKRYAELVPAEQRRDVDRRVAENEIRAEDQRKVEAQRLAEASAARARAEAEARQRAEEERRAAQRSAEEARVAAENAQRAAVTAKAQEWEQVRENKRGVRTLGVVLGSVGVAALVGSVVFGALGLNSNARVKAGGFADFDDLSRVSRAGGDLNGFAYVTLGLGVLFSAIGSLCFLLNLDAGPQVSP